MVFVDLISVWKSTILNNVWKGSILGKFCLWRILGLSKWGWGAGEDEELQTGIKPQGHDRSRTRRPPASSHSHWLAPPLPAALSPSSEGFVITGSDCFLLDEGFHITSVSARWFSIRFCGLLQFSSIWAGCLLCNLVVFHKSFIINFMWHDHQLGPRTLLDVNCSWGFGKSFCRAWMMEPEAVACTRRIMRELQTTIPDTTIFDTTYFFWLQSWVPILTTEALKLCCSILKIFFRPLSLSFLICSMYMFASPIWGVHRKLC